MMRQPCDLIIEGRVGASVYGVFAEARALAAQTGRDITVVGNSVRVTVTPDMTEEQCRYAYTRALVERESEKKPPHPAPERPAEETYTRIEDEIAALHKDLAYLSIALGAWHEARHDADLRRVAAAANGMALTARRVERLADEQVGKP